MARVLVCAMLVDGSPHDAAVLVAAVVEAAAVGARLRHPNDVDRTALARGCVGANGRPPPKDTFFSLGSDAVDRANTVVQMCAEVAARVGDPMLRSGMLGGSKSASGLLWEGFTERATAFGLGAQAATLVVPRRHTDLSMNPTDWFVGTGGTSTLAGMRRACRTIVGQLVAMREDGAKGHTATSAAVAQIREHVRGLPPDRVRAMVADNDNRGSVPVPLLAMAAALVSDDIGRDDWVRALFGAHGVPDEWATDSSWCHRRGEPAEQGGLFVPLGTPVLLTQGETARFVNDELPRRIETRRRLMRCFASDVEWMVGCRAAQLVLGAVPAGSVLTAGAPIFARLVRPEEAARVRSGFMQSGAAAWLWATVPAST